MVRIVFIAALLSLILHACGGKGTPPPASQNASRQPLNTQASPPPPQDSNGTYSETTLGASSQGQADQSVTKAQNATASQIMLPGLPYGEPDAESNDLQATACIQAKDHMGSSMQELQEILHKMIQKKLIVSALSGSSDDAAMARLSQHVDDSLLSGLIIDKEGYYNGKQFGELCVDARGKLSQALMAQYQKKRLSISDFCYSNPKVADNVLRPHAMTAALQQLATRQDSRLGDLSISELRDFLSRITVSNEKLNAGTHQLCLDIVADYDPMQARRTLQAHVMETTKAEDASTKTQSLQLAHYALYLDITPYPVGQPVPAYGDAISVVEAPQGKALGLTGTKSGWAVFTNLNQVGQDVPSALENKGKAPGPEDRFAFSDHPIGDFNATVTVAYNINMKPEDSPLKLDLLNFEYQDYVTQSVRINLTMDKDKRTYVSFDLEHTATNPIPFNWGHDPVALTLQKQKDVLKLYVKKQFIVSVPSPISPLYSISVNLLNNNMLYALKVDGEQARPQPRPPKGVAGMIPHSSKWTIPQLPGQQSGTQAQKQPASPDGAQPTAQQPDQTAPAAAPASGQQAPAAKETGK